MLVVQVPASTSSQRVKLARSSSITKNCLHFLQTDGEDNHHRSMSTFKKQGASRSPP